MMVTWDFGDGTTASGLGMLTTTHDYADSGVYRVIVTAADKDGGTGTNTFDVSIDNLAPSNLTNICACTPALQHRKTLRLNSAVQYATGTAYCAGQ